MAKSAVALAGTTADQIRKAYYEAEPDYYKWIREMFVDPPELIVQNDRDDSLERIPYTITGDGEVEFGDGQAVKVEYVAARASVSKPAVAFASRSEARPAAAEAAPESPSAAEAEDTQGKEGTMPTLKEGLVQKLGLTADADDDAVLTAFEAALAANAEAPAEDNGGTSTDAEATPEQIAAAAKKHGLTVLDAEVAQRLTADAAAGREARDRQQAEDDARIVDTAISKGKITPARREHFLASMKADREGTTTLLEKTLQESAIPLTEMGHSTEPVEDITKNPAYKNWSF